MLKSSKIDDTRANDGAKTFDAIMALARPIGIDAIEVLTKALDVLQTELKDAIRAKANELAARIPNEPYFVLSASPKANMACLGIGLGEMPTINGIGTDGPVGPIVVKDVMTALTMMSMAQKDGAAMIVRGNEGKYTAVTKDMVANAKAFIDLVPESMVSTEARDKWNRASRLIRTFEALGGVHAND